MRTMLSALTLGALLSVACGGSSSPTTTDLSASTKPSDLSVKTDFAGSTADLTMGASLCGDVLQCAEGCSNQSCVNTCYGTGTSSAQALFEQIFTCAKEQCAPADSGVETDGGHGSCTGADDTTSGCAACVKSQAGVAPCNQYVTTCLLQSS